MYVDSVQVWMIPLLVLVQEDCLLEGPLQEGVKLTTHDAHLVFVLMRSVIIFPAMGGSIIKYLWS